MVRAQYVRFGNCHFNAWPVMILAKSKKKNATPTSAAAAVQAIDCTGVELTVATRANERWPCNPPVSALID